MGNKTVVFDIDSDLAEKFEVALMLNKENKNEVITNLLVQYVAESFTRAAKSVTPQQPSRTSYLSDEGNNYAKANRKIPTWARKPQQNNHRIIKAYFELEEEHGVVTVEELSERCNSKTTFPNTYVTDFKGNFAQMKTDASNSHGKVFTVNDDIVEIWDEVKDVLMENKHLFTMDLDEGRELRMTKITKEMSEVGYEYAKKVYAGELTRTEGKIEIAKVTGMNAGSAQDFITDFLAMMEGSVYHRTLNNYTTKYFLESIKKDFGDEAFRLALEATEKHVRYYNGLGRSQLKGIEEIVKDLKE